METHKRSYTQGPYAFRMLHTIWKLHFLLSMQQLMPDKLLHACQTSSSGLERLQIDASNYICAVQHHRAYRHATCLYQKVCTPVVALLKHACIHAANQAYDQACKAALQPPFALHAHTNICHAALEGFQSLCTEPNLTREHPLSLLPCCCSKISSTHIQCLTQHSTYVDRQP